MVRKKKPHPGGRPHKFSEPSTRITITLPDSTLEGLSSIHPDRARAIVKATGVTLGMTPDRLKSVDIVEMIPGYGLIIVGPSAALRRIPWLTMIEITPSRYLLSIPSGTAIEVLEVAITDTLEHLKKTEQHEAEMLEALRTLLVRVRRASSVSKAELLIVKT